MAEQKQSIRSAGVAWYSPLSWQQADLLAVVITAIFGVLLLGYSLSAHTIISYASQEEDGFFLRAADLLAGKPYTDPFRPPLYALLTAGLSALVRSDVFFAGRLLSGLAATGLVWLSYWVARPFLNPAFALFAMLLVAVDSTVVLNGMYVATDALYALLLLALLACMLSPSRSSAARSAVLGLLFGLAYLTRYTSVFVLPLPLLWIWRGSGSRGAQLKALGVFTCVALATTAPWLVYNTAANGSPFANDNWKNFGMAVLDTSDYTYQYLRSGTYHGYLDVLMQHPQAVALRWLKNLVSIGLASVIIHSSSWLLGLFLPYGLLALWRSQPAGRVAVLYAAAIPLPIVLTFFYNHPRHLLPSGPVLIVASLLGLYTLYQRLRARLTLAPPIFNALAAGLVGIMWMLPAQNTIVNTTWLVANQPSAEVEMLRDVALEAPAQPRITILVPSSLLVPFVPQSDKVRLIGIDAGKGRTITELPSITKTTQADYMLLSDLLLYGQLSQALEARQIPACWSLDREAGNSAGKVQLYRNICR